MWNDGRRERSSPVIIDFHTHAFPDAIADRAVTKLAHNANWQPILTGKIGDLLTSMDRAGVDASVIAAVATKPGQAEGILAWCKAIASPRIVPFPSLHPLDPEAALWPKRFAEEGFRGVKMHPMYQDFFLDEPRMLDLYAAMAEAGLLLLMHMGQDIAWSDENDQASPARMAAALAAVPKLRLVAAHMGGWRGWDAAEQYLLGKDCVLETSMSLDVLPAQRALAMIRRHGVARTVWGTDSPWTDQKVELERLAELGLDPDEFRQIAGGNAQSLLALAE